jgi:FkbM family methyltransferase
VRLDDRHTLRLIHFGYQLENGLFWAGLDGAWERVSLGLWMKLCRRANVIMDVGANTGVYALIAARLRPDARIFAFEPLQRTFDKLQANVQLNAASIHCVNAAVSDHSGTATIYDPGDEVVYSISVNRNAYEGKPVSPVTIDTIRLDDFVQARKLEAIDLIKIDVETHEAEVLQGLGRYLREFRPALLVEIREEALAARIAELVAGLDYAYFNIDETAGVRRMATLGVSDYFNCLICSEETARSIGL